jgi:hypothetical protein
MKIQRVPVTANKEPATADEMTGNHNQEGFILFATNIHTTTATRPGQNDPCTSGSFSRRRTSRQIVGLIIDPFPPLHAGPDIFSLYVDKQTATTHESSTIVFESTPASSALRPHFESRNKNITADPWNINRTPPSKVNGPDELTVYWGATEDGKPFRGSVYKTKRLPRR